MTPFPDLLRHWRGQRRLSQLQLSLEAEVSARHISFLETGRAQPSRDMIARLGDALAMPFEARNQMLTSVGFSPKYAARNWDDADMAPVRRAVEWTLDRHAPFPGMAIDRFWTIRRLNAPARTLFSALGLSEGASLLALLQGPRMPQFIENWPEVAHHSVQRLRSESAAAAGIPEFEAAITHLTPFADQGQVNAPAVPTVFRMGDTRIALFGTIAQFGTSADQTIEDLKIELFFPADEASEALLKAMSPDPSAP